MSQEDDLRGLAKSWTLCVPQRIIRSCQYLLVLLSVHPGMERQYRSGGQDSAELPAHDRIVRLHPLDKAFLRYLPCPLVSGHEGCKGGKNQMGAYLDSPLRRCRPLLFQLVLLCLPVPLLARTAFYIFTLAVGYLCLLAAGVWISRLLKQNLMDDVFNNENESFMQETRLIENEYSVNLPTRFYYGKKWNDGWINVVNPFRAPSCWERPVRASPLRW